MGKKLSILFVLVMVLAFTFTSCKNVEKCWKVKLSRPALIIAKKRVLLTPTCSPFCHQNKAFNPYMGGGFSVKVVPAPLVLKNWRGFAKEKVVNIFAILLTQTVDFRKKDRYNETVLYR